MAARWTHSLYDAVVIGGSSGSIEALSTLLPALPATWRAPLLVVVHLPRHRPSLLSDIFGARCPLEQQEAHDQDVIEPGRVYYAPPDYHLLVDQGPRVALSVDPPVHFSRPSIDVLFDSAADVYGQRLIGILLSGANSDGARGMVHIHAAGGLTIVQDPNTAPMPTMPQAALACAPIPHALDPRGIAALMCSMHARGLI